MEGKTTEPISRNKVLSNLLWRFLERCGAQGVTFIVSLVLARLLDPAIYGTIAIVLVFTSILDVFVDSGLGNALIQKKDADDLDFSSVFFFNVCMCVVLYALIFLAAPLIASFYKKPELIALIRVMSLTVVVSGVKNIQHAYVSRNMLFKRFFYATLGGTISAAVVGIYMAYAGYGVWAIVAQHLLNVVMDTVILWATVRWRPKRMFSWERLRGLLFYGWKLLVSELLETVYTRLRQLIIGKLYTDEDLAFYNRGEQIPQFLTNNINTATNSVLFPAMAAEQDRTERVRSMTMRAITLSTYVIMPVMAGLAVCAEPIVRIILTEKWVPCVPFLQVFCIAYAFLPFHIANLNAVKAMGRSDLFLKMEILKKIVDLIILAIAMWFGPFVMALSLLAADVISQVINSWPNAKLIGYSYLKQLRDMFPNIALTLAMCLIIYPVRLLPLKDWALLLIQVPLGILVYVVGSKLIHNENYSYILSVLKRFTARGRSETAQGEEKE